MSDSLDTKAFRDTNLKAVNFIIGVRPETMQKYPASGMSAKEQSGVERLGQFRTVGSSYGSMHATKPATIGIVLSSSPIALLAWSV